MRLLRAELRKLRRPLVLWTAIAIISLVGLIAWGNQRNARDLLNGVSFGGGPVPSCSDMGLPEGSAQCQQQQDQQRSDFCAGQNLPEGPACDAAIAQAVADMRQQQEQFIADREREAVVTKAMQTPFGAGILAAGMMASMIGAVVIMLLAAGHVGNEWSAKTIKQVLAQEGRRSRVMAAKVLSLWVLGIGLLLLLWLVLAILAPIFHAAYHLPGPRVSSAAALKMSLKPAARAVLVIGVFAALGTLSAVITRNTLGSFFLAFAFVVASMIVASFKAVVKFTLAYHVAGWMGFHTVAFGPPTYLWRDSFYPTKNPTHTIGLVGLVVTFAVLVALTILRVERSDVKA